MPPAQVELGYGDESLNGVVDRGQREKRLGVGHEAGSWLACVLALRALGARRLTL